MSAVAPQEDQPVREQIEETHEKIGGLQQNLHAIDAELEGLAAQREQYQMLAQVCGSLEKLDELGVAGLFWGQRVAEDQAAGHVQQVRGRIDAFQEQLGAIQDRRRAILDEIEAGHEVLDILEDDLFEIEEREDERKQEWIVEREPTFLHLEGRPQVMPWTRGGADDWRFRKSLAASLLIGLLLGSIVPMIDLPFIERSEVIEVPERLARFIRQEQQIPLPPRQPEPEEPRPQEEVPEPEPVLAEETPVVAPEVQEEPAPIVAQEPAPEERARSTGILAFRESFSSLAETRPSAQLGSEARINTAGEAAIGRTERSMVTTEGPGSSGGINLASLSRDVGGGAGGDGREIDGVELTRVASSIGAGGTSDRPLSGGAAAGRTDEEIQIVFDRYKSALYRLYNRELRNDPTLRGQMVLRLTIEPDGSVSFCELQSSTMNAPVLEQQVVERVLAFDFGAKTDIPAITILYPIDFLPAG